MTTRRCLGGRLACRCIVLHCEVVFLCIIFMNSSNYLLCIKRPNMKVTESTWICSAHFAPGCTVPNVRSPSLTKQEQPARRVLIRNSVKTRSKHCTPVLSLSKLCKKYVNATIAKSEHLEHANDAMKEELILQGSTCSNLKAKLSHASQQVATLQAQHEFLQAQHRASADKVESLQNQLSKLSLKNESLQKKFICMRRSAIGYGLKT